MHSAATCGAFAISNAVAYDYYSDQCNYKYRFNLLKKRTDSPFCEKVLPSLKTIGAYHVLTFSPE